MRSYAELVTYSSATALPLDQVIREELQRLILRYLSERGFFVHGVFRGGTAIRLVYGGTRFSEDLDFVLRPGRTIASVSLAGLLEGLPSFMRREVPFADRSTLREQKAEATFARYRCRLELQAPIGGLVINLEFSGVPSRSPRPHVMRSDTVDVAIVVEDESEILVDKLVALALRSYVKGRDIWDTWFLSHERHVAVPEVGAVVAKTADYGTTLVDLTSRIRHSKTRIETSGLAALDAEMKRFLPARLYDAMAPAFPDINTSVAAMMDILLNQLTGTS
ncbi:MAG TPA: nucleotidyl transferase AbiEii/AbiGii toxin family protein [Candidatus Deferrimicrobium sp.]|nr:nucleotidyl transferase AbiEii/AbiGii toxin family protein [Candidatus Deferrimicrobium sp.]